MRVLATSMTTFLPRCVTSSTRGMPGARRLVVALNWRYWGLTGRHTEALTWLELALRLPSEDVRPRISGLTAVALRVMNRAAASAVGRQPRDEIPTSSSRRSRLADRHDTPDPGHRQGRSCCVFAGRRRAGRADDLSRALANAGPVDPGHVAGHAGALSPRTRATSSPSARHRSGHRPVRVGRRRGGVGRPSCRSLADCWPMTATSPVRCDLLTKALRLARRTGSAERSRSMTGCASCCGCRTCTGGSVS